MKIKDAPIGSKVVCCNATAEVINRGNMGTHVKVITIPERSGFCLGSQIWSNETLVKGVNNG